MHKNIYSFVLSMFSNSVRIWKESYDYTVVVWYSSKAEWSSGPTHTHTGKKTHTHKKKPQKADTKMKHMWIFSVDISTFRVCKIMYYIRKKSFSFNGALQTGEPRKQKWRYESW